MYKCFVNAICRFSCSKIERLNVYALGTVQYKCRCRLPIFKRIKYIKIKCIPNNSPRVLLSQKARQKSLVRK